MRVQAVFSRKRRISVGEAVLCGYRRLSVELFGERRISAGEADFSSLVLVKADLCG